MSTQHSHRKDVEYYTNLYKCPTLKRRELNIVEALIDSSTNNVKGLNNYIGIYKKSYRYFSKEDFNLLLVEALYLSKVHKNAFKKLSEKYKINEVKLGMILLIPYLRLLRHINNYKVWDDSTHCGVVVHNCFTITPVYTSVNYYKNYAKQCTQLELESPSLTPTKGFVSEVVEKVLAYNPYDRSRGNTGTNTLLTGERHSNLTKAIREGRRKLFEGLF